MGGSALGAQNFPSHQSSTEGKIFCDGKRAMNIWWWRDTVILVKDFLHHSKPFQRLKVNAHNIPHQHCIMPAATSFQKWNEFKHGALPKRGLHRWTREVSNGCDMTTSPSLLTPSWILQGARDSTHSLTHAAFIFHYETEHEMYNKVPFFRARRGSRLISHIIN